MVKDSILKKEAEAKKASEGGMISEDGTSRVGMDGEEEAEGETRCLGNYPTKRTPVFKLQFTHSNLLCAAGPFQKEK